MTQLVIKLDTIHRLEGITGQHIIRGGDKIINKALDVMQNRIHELESSQ